MKFLMLSEGVVINVQHIISMTLKGENEIRIMISGNHNKPHKNEISILIDFDEESKNITSENLLLALSLEIARNDKGLITPEHVLTRYKNLFSLKNLTLDFHVVFV